MEIDLVDEHCSTFVVSGRQPNLLSVTWTRRNRRFSTEPHIWEPSMKNPLKGLVVWAVPENKEASITLFGDPRSQEFEEKFWNFVLEDVSGPFRLMQSSLGFSESLILRKLLEKVLVETVPIHKNSGFFILWREDIPKKFAYQTGETHRYVFKMLVKIG